MADHSPRAAAGAAPPPPAAAAPGFAAFLSHYQATGADQALVLREALHALGARAWLDVDQEPTVEGMRAGVAAARAFVLVLSNNVLARAAVRLEVATALALGKPLAFVLEAEAG